MSNGECSVCGALGEVIEGMCYTCYEDEEYGDADDDILY